MAAIPGSNVQHKTAHEIHLEQQLASAKAEIERLQAHNAMLVEVFHEYMSDRPTSESSV